jgi:hypothetical protein
MNNNWDEVLLRDLPLGARLLCTLEDCDCGDFFTEVDDEFLHKHADWKVETVKSEGFKICPKWEAEYKAKQSVEEWLNES